MTVPHEYFAALLLTVLTMLCWGSWANVVKIVGNWRFELLCFDYAFGILLASIVAGLTFGSMGGDGLPFLDDLATAGRWNMVYGFTGGVVFNLSNFLVVGAIAVAGLGVAFPVGVGLALVVGVVWNYFVNPQGNPMLLFAGVALVVAAIVTDAIAYRVYAATMATGAASSADPSEAKKRTAKGLRLSVIGGLLMGMFYPLVELGKKGDGGLGPYGVGFIFSLGIFVSTFAFGLYFMKNPVQGKPLKLKAYLRARATVHLLGIAGGLIWATGTLASFIAASAPKELQVGPAVSYALGQGSTMVGAFWGVFIWKEFAEGGTRVNRLLLLMFVLFLSGLGLVSVAPLYSVR